jgi:hypothetical protein
VSSSCFLMKRNKSYLSGNNSKISNPILMSSAVMLPLSLRSNILNESKRLKSGCNDKSYLTNSSSLSNIINMKVSTKNYELFKSSHTFRLFFEY